MVMPADQVQENDAVMMQMWEDLITPGPMPLRVASVDNNGVQTTIVTVLAGTFQVSKDAQLCVLREVTL